MENKILEHIAENKIALLDKLYNSDVRPDGKKVLIIDDDVRNIFALTSVLEQYSMDVFSAPNGKEGIQLLTKNNNIDFVLMDIMMPEMDDYETMTAIRKKMKMTEIPIIALTAKAIKGDREKCIQAAPQDIYPNPLTLNN